LEHLWGIKDHSALLLRLQLGYTKFHCFLNEWDSSARKHLYIQKQYSKRESLIPGQDNIVNAPLTNPEIVNFMRKLKGDWSEGMLAIIRCRILCLPVCYPKI